MSRIKKMKEYKTNSAEETKKLASETAHSLKGGEVLGLVGDLGAGKTVFVQGLAETLGIKEIVNSPTFVLMKVYQVSNQQSAISKLIHVDAYRLSNSQELKDIGLDEYLAQKDSVVIIEWADKVKDLLPPGSLMIEFKAGPVENQRIVYVNN